MVDCGNSSDPNALTTDKCNDMAGQLSFLKGPNQATDLETVVACAKNAASCVALNACFTTVNGSFTGGTIYVAPSPTGNDENNGTSPMAPKATLKAALSIAQAGSILKLASGTYRECLWLFGSVRIMGSYSSDFAAQSPEVMSTLIDAEGLHCQPIVVMSTVPESVVQLAGLTVTHGEANVSMGLRTDEGGGIYVTTGKLGLDHVTVSHNISADDGGGLAAYDGAQVTIVDSVFLDNNTTGNAGGGLTCGNATVDVERTNFESNSATLYGGGMNFWECTATVSDSRVTKNTTASSGGGIQFGGAPGNSSYSLGTTIFSENAPNAVVGTYTNLGGNSLL
jgi:hypothetical protein